MKGIQNTTTENFSTIIGNNKRFVVPKFQRDYSWESEQWDDLWRDIEDMRTTNEEHYMGYLVLQTNNDKTFRIIDGQQRFTTITLLILAAIKSIKKIAAQKIDEENNTKRAQHFMTSFVGKEDPVTLVYDDILQLNRNNDGYFRDYIVPLGDLRVRNLKASEKLMKGCFEHFEKLLSQLNYDGKQLAEFIQDVTEKLYFTTISVTDELNAFKVFETLNARGVQLSSSDLLKNYLFSLVDRDTNHTSHIDTLEEKWSALTDNIKSEKLPEFLRYYWNAKHKVIRSNAVFKTIQKEITSATQVFEIVNDMIRYSDIYMALGDRNDELWEDDEVRNDIELLNLFRLKQPYSLLMTAKLKLSSNDFKRVLRSVIVICFRYNVICDKNPNDQDTPFNSLAIKINNEGVFNKDDLSKLYVSDEEFEHSFTEKAMPYNSRSAKVVRYIIGKIDKFYGSNREVRPSEDEASIEHILPQNYDASWKIDDEKASHLINRLGNMCLLERKLNRDIQNASFAEKKSVYEHSAYKSARDIWEQYEEWTEDSIIKNQKKMAMAAKSIWKL